jgi:hypothetical protein
MKKFGILILLLVSVSCAMYAQEKKSKKERRQEQAEMIQKIVEAQDFRFVAQRTLPSSFRSVNLTSEYFMSVSKDNINTHLPYFGRVYVAPMNPAEGGIKFESTNFDYRLENAKRGGWVAHIDINDARRKITMILSVTTSGSANLSVIEDTRQAISYSGYIEERLQNR